MDDAAAEPRDRSVGSSSNGSRSNGSGPTGNGAAGNGVGNGAAPGVDDWADALDEPPLPERPSLTVHHVALLEK